MSALGSLPWRTSQWWWRWTDTGRHTLLKAFLCLREITQLGSWKLGGSRRTTGVLLVEVRWGGEQTPSQVWPGDRCVRGHPTVPMSPPVAPAGPQGVRLVSDL